MEKEWVLPNNCYGQNISNQFKKCYATKGFGQHIYTAEEVKRLSPKIKLPLGGESMQSKPDPETAIKPDPEDQSSNVGPEY